MKRVFIDMDGVICEYKKNASVSDMENPGFFRALRPRTEAVDAVRCLLTSGDADVYILSAVLPEIREACIREKNEWLCRYLPEINAQHRVFSV